MKKCKENFTEFVEQFEMWDNLLQQVQFAFCLCTSIFTHFIIACVDVSAAWDSLVHFVRRGYTSVKMSTHVITGPNVLTWALTTGMANCGIYKVRQLHEALQIKFTMGFCRLLILYHQTGLQIQIFIPTLKVKVFVSHKFFCIKFYFLDFVLEWQSQVYLHTFDVICLTVNLQLTVHCSQ